MESSFCRKYDVKTFTDSTQYNFFTEMVDKMDSAKKSCKECKNSIDFLSEEARNLVEAFEDSYGIEKKYYENKIANNNSKRKGLEEKIEEESELFTKLKEEVNREEFYLNKYFPVDSEFSEKKYSHKFSGNRLSATRSSRNFGLHLPEFVFYNIDSSEVLLNVSYKFNSGGDMVHSKISSSDLSGEYEEHDSVKAYDSPYSLEMTLKSTFNSKISQFKESIEEAKKDFDDIYVVSRSHWLEEDSPDFARDEDDFMIVGKRNDVDRFYFIAESVDGNDFDYPRQRAEEAMRRKNNHRGGERSTG